MERFEYIRCFWKYIDNETPVVLFYEVDCLNERYAVRMTEIFPDRSAEIGRASCRERVYVSV